MSLPLEKSAAAKRSSKPRPATSTPPQKLLISVDFGTTKIDACGRIKQPNEALTMNKIFSVGLGRKKAAPQIMGYDVNRNFLYGDKVDDAITRNKMSPESAIRLIKLALYKDHKTSAIAKRVDAWLEQFSTTKEEVLGLLIRDVIQTTKTQAESVRGMWQSVEDGMTVDQMKVELFLSVPEMWKAPANRVMTVAARKAGVDVVQLVSEPRCAAAYFMHDILTTKRTSLQAGDGILVLDIGGGTTDITLYVMPAPESAGAQVELQRIGDAVGGLCGSQFINEAFLDWLQGHADDNLGGFDANVRRLGYAGAPYTGFHLAANEAFDQLKPAFTPATAASDKSMYVTITGNPESPTYTNPVWVVTLPYTQMKSFFDEVIEANFRLLDPLITPKIKRIIGPGGLMNSEYCRNELESRLQPNYPHLKISEGDAMLLTGQQPVSAGALLRYSEIDINATPRTGCFGLATDETFDPIRHPDGVIKAGTALPSEFGTRPRRSGKDGVDRKIVHASEFTDSDEALSRWDPILRAASNNSSPSSHVDHVTGTWQTRFIDVVDKSQLEFQIYWTDNTSIVPGSAIFEGDPNDGVLRDEVEEWGPPIFVDCPDFKALGFDVKLTPSTKKEVYQIAYLVEVRERGPNAAVKIRLVLPSGRQPFDQNGDPMFLPDALPDDVELLDILDEPLNEEDFSAFTRS